MNHYNAENRQVHVHLDQYGYPLVPVNNVQGSVINQNHQPPPTVITRDDVLKKIKKIEANTVKQLLFYESLLTRRPKVFFDFDNDDAYNFLTDQMLTYPNIFQQLDYLISIKTYSSISDSFLTWFSDDLRAGLYFSSYVDLEWYQDCFYGGTEFLHWIKSIIKTSTLEIGNHISIKPNFDTNQNLRESNIRNLNIIKRKYLNDRTRPNKIDWFDLEDTEQVKWGYDYLDEREKITLNGTFFPKTTKDKYNLVLASIDISDDKKVKYTVPNGENELAFTERGYFIYKMRRAWNSILTTRKKSEKKSKRIITVTPNNYDILLKLSSYQKLSTDKMVNKLIEDEYSLIGDHIENS